MSASDEIYRKVVRVLVSKELPFTARPYGAALLATQAAGSIVASIPLLSENCPAQARTSKPTPAASAIAPDWINLCLRM